MQPSAQCVVVSRFAHGWHLPRSLRGDSTYVRTQTDFVAKAMVVSGGVLLEPGRTLSTRVRYDGDGSPLSNRPFLGGTEVGSHEVVDFVRGGAHLSHLERTGALNLRGCARPKAGQGSVIIGFN
jgi:hypothetical protein